MSVGRWCPIQQMVCWDRDCSEGCEITHEAPTATTPLRPTRVRPAVSGLGIPLSVAFESARWVTSQTLDFMEQARTARARAADSSWRSVLDR